MRQGRVETPPSAHSPLQKSNFQQNKQQIFSELTYREMPGNSSIKYFSPDNQCLASAFSRVILLFMNHAPHFLKPNTPFRELKIHPIHPPTHDLFHQNHTPTDNEKTAIFGVGEGEIMPKNDLSEVATGGDGTKKRTKSLAL